MVQKAYTRRNVDELFFTFTERMVQTNVDHNLCLAGFSGDGGLSVHGCGEEGAAQQITTTRSRIWPWLKWNPCPSSAFARVCLLFDLHTPGRYLIF